MRVYISSHCLWAARYVADCLPRWGHQAISTWHEDRPRRMDEFDEAERQSKALRNFREITNADALILIASPDKVPGGKFVEAGIALGSGKAVFLIGRRENLLMSHPGVHQFDTPGEACKALDSVAT